MLALLNTSDTVKLCKTVFYDTIIFVVKTLPMEQKCFLVIAPSTINFAYLARGKIRKEKSIKLLLPMLMLRIPHYGRQIKAKQIMHILLLYFYRKRKLTPERQMAIKQIISEQQFIQALELSLSLLYLHLKKSLKFIVHLCVGGR